MSISSIPTREYVRVELLKQKILSWTAAAGSEDLILYVGVDSGATNTRVAVATPNEFEVFYNFQCNSTRELIVNLRQFAEELSKLVDCAICVRAGCFGAAGRVTEFGHRVEITNYREGDGNIHRNLSLSELPRELFPEGRSRILNDLESACYGVSGLSANRRLNQYFQVLLGPDELRNQDISQMSFDNYLVVAIGTGMGVGLLMALTGHDSFQVLPMEAGHIQFSPSPLNDPRCEEETDMIKYIGGQLYQNASSLEYEDLASGRGLIKLYEWITKDQPNVQPISAVEISRKAIEEQCPFATKALLYHYLYLARGSANLAVGLRARGIFWAGGNQVSNQHFVQSHRDELYREFITHPKFEWIRDIPVFAQTLQFNINLEGAFYVCKSVLDVRP